MKYKQREYFANSLHLTPFTSRMIFLLIEKTIPVKQLLLPLSSVLVKRSYPLLSEVNDSIISKLHSL